MINNKDFKHVLYLPAWYPHPKDSMFGLFVKNHALAASRFINVSVLYVVFYENQKENYKVEIKTDSNFTELIILVKKPSKYFWFFGKLVQLIRFITAYKAGYKIIHDSVGKPDLTHVHILSRMGAIAFWFKKKYKIPYLISEHWSRYLPENKSYRGFLRKILTKKVVKNAQIVITVSNYLQSAMKNSGLSSTNWKTIPNVVDTRRFRVEKSDETRTFFRFFHISCFEEKSKNISSILDAVKIVASKNPNFELMMIGDGIDLKMIKEKCTNLDLNKYIKFTGVLENEALINTINACDFMVLYSNYETFGTVVLESFACGKPVIVSNGGALPEITPEKFGIIVPLGKPDALADAILQMMSDYKNYNSEEMSDFVSENYSQQTIGFQLNKLYESILSCE